MAMGLRSALLTAWLLSSAGCLEHEAVDLSDKGCPCAEGWTCDEATGTCVRGEGGGGGSPRDAGAARDAGGGGDDAGAGDDAGSAEDAGPTTTTFWLEAESGTLEAPMQTGDDAEASGGSYVTVDPAQASSTDARPAMGKVSLSFTVTEAADFRVWARVQVPDMNGDSFWVCMDDCAAEYRWNDLSMVGSAGSWVWDDVHDSDAAGAVAIWSLEPGDHTLHVYYREVGAMLDKVAITDDPDLMPTGLGE